jgi:hypothetical protein
MRAPDSDSMSRAEVAQQRLDLAPLDVAADRIVKDGAEQVFVFVAHGIPGAQREGGKSGRLRLRSGAFRNPQGYRTHTTPEGRRNF